LSTIYRAARRPAAAAKSVRREILEWALTLGLAVGLALCVHTWVGGIVTIDGPSMQAGLWKGEKVLIGKTEYYFAKPKRGDIVLTHFPDSDENYIKRVIGLGGETLAIRSGSVYINGKKLDEPYLPEPIQFDFDEITVPEGSIFVMGDNRNDSHDSRDVGALPLSMVEGRAYALVWPVGKFTKLTGYTGSFEK
jgi:signal peptidase I